MKFLKTYKQTVLFLVVFTLPMFTIVNNVLLALYVVMVVLEGSLLEKFEVLKKNALNALPVFLLFLLALVASAHNASGNPLHHIEKYWSFLLIPMIFLCQKNFFKQNKELIFNALVYGCFMTLLICYINSAYEIIANNEPIDYFFRWRHLGHQFTEIADTHPAYLGLFIIISALFLFNNKTLSDYIKIPLLIFFTIGLFQLASRMALLIYLVLAAIMIWKNLRINPKALAWLIALSGIVLIVLLSFGSPYYKQRIFSFSSITKDARFERLAVSYEMFKEHPILGVGFGKKDEIRIEKYKQLNFEIASDKNYNAHNQFMETLSTNGIIGGIVYIYVLGFLLIKSFHRKEYLFSVLFLIFTVSNLTESMLVRIKGIEFFAIFSTLFLSSLIKPSARE